MRLNIIFPILISIFVISGMSWGVEGVFTNYLNGESINDLTVEGEYIWIATDSGVTRWNNITKESVRYTTTDGLCNNNVMCVSIDTQGVIWFGTLGGVSSFDGTTWKNYTQTDGLVNNSVYCIAIDNQGMKWFGTFGGASCFDGTTWKTYTRAEAYGLPGLASNSVYSIAIDTQGVIWFATDDGVSRFDGITWKRYAVADGLANYFVTSITIDIQGVIWFGTLGGVSSFNGTNWKTYTTADGLANNNVKCVAIDKQGVKWFSTIWNGVKESKGGGITSLNGTIWKTYTTSEGLVNDMVNCIYIDSDGSLLFGTDDGISKFTPLLPSGVYEKSVTPTSFILHQNYPNPFNLSTTISFYLFTPGFTELSVYNMAGQKVRELIAEQITIGAHTAVWDGKDAQGKAVSSGIYFSVLKAGGRTEAGKMMMVK